MPPTIILVPLPIITSIHSSLVTHMIPQSRGFNSNHLRRSNKYIRSNTRPPTPIIVVAHVLSSVTLLTVSRSNISISVSSIVPVTTSSHIAQLVQGSTLVDLIGFVLYKPTLITAIVSESLIPVSIVESNIATNYMVVEPSVPLDTQMQLGDDDVVAIIPIVPSDQFNFEEVVIWMESYTEQHLAYQRRGVAILIEFQLPLDHKKQSSQHLLWFVVRQSWIGCHQH